MSLQQIIYTVVLLTGFETRHARGHHQREEHHVDDEFNFHCETLGALVGDHSGDHQHSKIPVTTVLGQRPSEQEFWYSTKFS